MTNHTPGPWEYRNENIIYQDKNECDYTIASVHRNVIANAQLIASAPELLEACKSMIEAIEAMPKGWNGTKLFQEDIYNIIAKAEGKK